MHDVDLLFTELQERTEQVSLLITHRITLRKFACCQLREFHEREGQWRAHVAQLTQQLTKSGAELKQLEEAFRLSRFTNQHRGLGMMKRIQSTMNGDVERNRLRSIVQCWQSDCALSSKHRINDQLRAVETRFALQTWATVLWGFWKAVTSTLLTTWVSRMASAKASDGVLEGANNQMMNELAKAQQEGGLQPNPLTQIQAKYRPNSVSVPID